MMKFKSFLFIICFFLWSIIINILFIPSLILPRNVIVFGQRFWALGSLAILKIATGVCYEVKGKSNIPDEAHIVALKHQSMWDTIVLHIILNDPAIVMKKELLKIPIYGWYCIKSKMIPIDRSSGPKSLKMLLKLSQQASKEKRPIAIFPQGTRISPGAKASYLPGVAALYKNLHIPVVPVALNSGLFWPKNKFIVKKGIITFEFLEIIEPGLDKKKFIKILEKKIEESSNKLSK
ncbi:1-acyl-sn-glycerol-3-phosphate acyltransferase [Alphaproteobacteria bacterium]|nr:1-acyl-sn-glycerol-3-phosphate acyltransferase [Alphaproteobacteria bacterium]